VQVHVIMDRMNGELGRLRSRLPSLVRLSTNVETEGFEDAVMHSKCVVVDQNIVIIGSWNFTSYGLHSNLELGIITSDHQLAMDIQSWLDSCFKVGALTDL